MRRLHQLITEEPAHEVTRWYFRQFIRSMNFYRVLPDCNIQLTPGSHSRTTAHHGWMGVQAATARASSASSFCRIALFAAAIMLVNAVNAASVSGQPRFFSPQSGSTNRRLAEITLHARSSNCCTAATLGMRGECVS